MADENENSAASGKFIFKLKLAGDGNCVDNAITENSLRLGFNSLAQLLAPFRNARVNGKKLLELLKTTS